MVDHVCTLFFFLFIIHELFFEISFTFLSPLPKTKNCKNTYCNTTEHIFNHYIRLTTYQGTKTFNAQRVQTLMDAMMVTGSSTGHLPYHVNSHRSISGIHNKANHSSFPLRNLTVYHKWTRNWVKKKWLSSTYMYNV